MKRKFAGVLWLAVGWTVGSMLTLGYGLPAVFAPLLGVAMAIFVIRDPLGLIWAQPAAHERSQEPARQEQQQELSRAA